MQRNQASAHKIYLIIVAVLAWVGLVIQFYIIISNRVVSIPETIVRYFSYFTILSNLVVALYSSYTLLKPGGRLGKFFAQPNVVAAITLYITIVGITYNAILRDLWSPKGLEIVGDELTHLIVPLSFLLYWLLFIPKGGLKWKDSFPWMIYPIVYLSWVLIFGALSGFYPYFFINVTEIGYSKVILNSGMMVIGFFLLSLLFIGIDKLMKPKLSVT
ncbi:MAG: Pr6Pr family membrane protein [Chitinophagaceae bacterium]